MINFYDLISYDNINLENYSISMNNTLNNIIFETDIVTEGSLSSITSSIKNFFKKIWNFLKKWWTKFWKFLGIDEDSDSTSNTSTESEDVDDDADRAIRKEKDKSKRDRMEKMKYNGNYKELKTALDKLYKGGVLKVNDNNIVRTNELYRFSKKTMSGKEYDEIIRYNILNEETNSILLVDIDKLQEKATSVYSIKNPLFGNFFDILEKIIDIEKDVINNIENGDNDNALGYINKIIEATQDFQDIQTLEPDKSTDYLYEVTGTNNRLMFSYASVLSRITFAKYIKENKKNSDILMGRLEILPVKINKYIEANKEYFENYSNEISQVNNVIQRMSASFTKIITYMNSSMGIIEKTLKSANKDLLEKYIDEVKSGKDNEKEGE